MIVKPAYRVYIVTGFVVSGWFYFMFGRIKIPSEIMNKWEAMPIPTKDLKTIYFGLELWRRIKQIFKRNKSC